MPHFMIVVEGKKMIWDGSDYTSEVVASEKMQKYKDDGFEVELFQEDGNTYLYTRRVVKDVVVQDA